MARVRLSDYAKQQLGKEGIVKVMNEIYGLLPGQLPGEFFVGLLQEWDHILVTKAARELLGVRDIVLTLEQARREQARRAIKGHPDVNLVCMKPVFTDEEVELQFEEREVYIGLHRERR
jgi:hypothetical protein